SFFRDFRPTATPATSVESGIRDGGSQFRTGGSAGHLGEAGVDLFADLRRHPLECIANTVEGRHDVPPGFSMIPAAPAQFVVGLVQKDQIQFDRFESRERAPGCTVPVQVRGRRPVTLRTNACGKARGGGWRGARISGPSYLRTLADLLRQSDGRD